MVFESLVNPVSAESHPWKMFLLGVFYSTVGVLLSMWVFYQWSSLVMVFLTVLASVPLFYNTMRYEEKKDKEIHDEGLLLKQHGKALFFMMMVFLGFVFGYALWYLVLPEATTAHAFSAQITTIQAINAPTGRVVSISSFMKIFSNNMRVLFFCIFFAFFYGAGAIFILAWNASIIGVAMGNFIRRGLAEVATEIGFVSAGAYLQVLSLGILRYMTHGIFEILGYFVGGLAGGIISVAVIRHDFGSKDFNHIIADSLDLVIISIVTLFLAALIEVYITPLMF
jgi:uncharacterized membrane protein SpoIIM required for sporulation